MNRRMETAMGKEMKMSLKRLMTEHPKLVSCKKRAREKYGISFFGKSSL
jgi:hypothetical protein